jgi:N-acetylneuraminic acid mutarotase
LPAAETAQAERGWYLDVGGVRYSPKADDTELLRDGYHKDRSARTRQAELWEQRAASDLSGRACPAAVWTGTDMVVFGGEGIGTSFDNGARYCLAEDTWAMLPEKGAPSSRTGHTMVWTGKEAIVWGGFGGLWGNNTNHNDGARYNPASHTWKPVSTKNAPAPRFDFPAAWTGKEMIVWGGYTDNQSRYQGAHADAYLNTGGRYDPASDIWKAITSEGAPTRRSFHTLLWTGKEMIIWGGGNANKVLSDGARYNPARNAWRPISTDGAPSPRYGHASVWTGKEMIVWGGSAREPSDPSNYFENDARYNPATDTWKPISTIRAPKGRVSATAVWTGTEMVLWGGVNNPQAGDGGSGDRFVGTGARYNPATDTWTEITTTGAPSPRLTSVVWTGDGLLAFGGYNGGHLNDTWFYSPQRTLYPFAKQ